MGLHAHAMDLASQGLQELGHDDRPGSVHAVQGHPEPAFFQSRHIQPGKGEDPFQVPIHGLGIPHHRSQRFPGRPGRVLGLQIPLKVCHDQGIQEQTCARGKLQGVPLPWIMAGCDPDPPCRVGLFHGQHEGGRGNHSQIHHPAPHTL